MVLFFGGAHTVTGLLSLILGRVGSLNSVAAPTLPRMVVEQAMIKENDLPSFSANPIQFPCFFNHG